MLQCSFFFKDRRRLNGGPKKAIHVASVVNPLEEALKMRTIALLLVAAACMWAGMTYPNTFSTEPSDFNYGDWPKSWGPEGARDSA